MATFEFITRADLEQFKKELFAELRRPSLQFHKRDEPKQWLKSYEVRKLLNISAGTLATFRRNGTIKYTKVGGLMYYNYADLLMLMDTK